MLCKKICQVLVVTVVHSWLLCVLTLGLLDTYGRWRLGLTVVPQPDRKCNLRLTVNTGRLLLTSPKPSYKPPPNYSIPILCYHDINDKASRWAISPEKFESHLKTLKEANFSFLTVSEAVDLLTGKWSNPIPQKSIVITIDDGYRSAYTVAFPLLRKYEAKATLCVYTSCIGKLKGFLSWEELKQMVESGRVEIASHTVNHAYPFKLRHRLKKDKFHDRVSWELTASKKILDQNLGQSIMGLAYPGGQVDENLKVLAQKAGYRWALTINPKPVKADSDFYALPRFCVDNTISVSVLLSWLKEKPRLKLAHRKPKG